MAAPAPSVSRPSSAPTSAPSGNRSPGSRSVTPRTPPSPTSVFAPPPSTVSGRALLAQRRSSATSASARARAHEDLRRAAHAHAGERRERRVGAAPPARERLERAQQCGGGAHGPQALPSACPSRPSSSGPTLGDVARAEREHDVALACSARQQRLRQVGALLHVGHVAVAVGAHRLRQRVAGGARNRLLAGRVDAGDEEHVRVVERGGELLQQVARARVAVRLEGHHHAAAEGAARAGQRGHAPRWGGARSRPPP